MGGPDFLHAGAAGGAPCGDLVRVALRVDGATVAAADAEATGCAAVRAAGDAVVELVEGAPVLEAARLTPGHVADALGGLSPAGRHGAELAADALHRALGAAARDGAALLVPDANRTLVAMSGGVDSAVAAQLAVDAGHDTLAVTLELWADPATDGTQSCCSPQAVLGARELAHSMGVPHFTLDVRERFRSEVVERFVDGYVEGSTPNPCVSCNGFVRFDAMLALAEALGAARLATGHYARVAYDAEGPLLRAAVDPGKDQSYMLARLFPEELERLWFPLGETTKDEVRDLARARGIPVADKRESQDLCFLAGIGRHGFLRRHAAGRLAGPGDVVREDGTVVGRHGGHHEFTVGQRRGLGVASREPLYVLGKDAPQNRVVVGERSALSTARVALRDARLHREPARVDAVKLRYRSAPVPCAVSPPSSSGRLDLDLDSPVGAVAPGQTACLLSEDRVVGVGTIA
jgi:tRNA-uridine 2-sulfurtransferase